MSTNPEAEGVVPLRPYPAGAEGAWPAPAPVAQPEAAVAAPVETPIAQPVAERPAAVSTRGGRGWMAVVAVAFVGLVVSGTLGYFLYETTGQRDAAQRQATSTQATLTGTQATLNSTQATLASTQQDLAARDATVAYASMYVTDSGRVRTDYQKLVSCTSFGACRTAAQSTLIDLQTFQADRSAATVPPRIANSDAMLRDALSAAIAADQQLISGFDTFSVNKVTAGLKKLNAAMLSMGKAETVLGPELK
jgi:sensor c-di-GMP phosphodiesterase-like protein